MAKRGRPPIDREKRASHVVVQIDSPELKARIKTAQPEGTMQKDFTSYLIRLGLDSSYKLRQGV